MVGHTACVEYGRLDQWHSEAVEYIKDNSVLRICNVFEGFFSYRIKKCPVVARLMAVVSLDG